MPFENNVIEIIKDIVRGIVLDHFDFFVDNLFFKFNVFRQK